jgi:endonuclease/exonuclease/phosphatase family metal-dependent hydrolase
MPKRLSRFNPGKTACCCIVFHCILLSLLARGETVRIATYNVENYLDTPTQTRRAKNLEAKAMVCENIIALKPDVLALQEIGSLSALEELRGSLKNHGLDLPFSEFVTGFDTNAHLAILSKLPFKALHPHTNDTFLLGEHRFRVSRGFAEAEIQVGSNRVFTLINAHLKSKRLIAEADQAELRLEEARLLREKVDSLFATNPNVSLLVLGDLNDTRDADSTRIVIGRGKTRLVDTRPAERNGDTALAARRKSEVTWTHFYAKEDLYSRIDYILLSPAMAKNWCAKETYILSVANWGAASDHRPLVSTFVIDD